VTRRGPDGPTLERWRHRPLNYPDAGMTRGDPPAGYRVMRDEAIIGRGEAVFAGAVEMLLSWNMHRRAGLDVAASMPRVGEGALVVQCIAVAGLARIEAGCRVVYVLNDDRRRGFAYGALAGHPETGEESFVVRHHADDTVTFTITAFSRPGRWYSRLGGPVTARIQRKVVGRYLDALRVPGSAA
jgi:uncharacterized protein (UPF0548 family)